MRIYPYKNISNINKYSNKKLTKVCIARRYVQLNPTQWDGQYIFHPQFHAPLTFFLLTNPTTPDFCSLCSLWGIVSYIIFRVRTSTLLKNNFPLFPATDPHHVGSPRNEGEDGAHHPERRRCVHKRRATRVRLVTIQGLYIQVDDPRMEGGWLWAARVNSTATTAGNGQIWLSGPYWAQAQRSEISASAPTSAH